MKNDLRDRVALSLAISLNSDYFYEEIDSWEAMEDWEQEAYPDEYPEMAYDDLEDFLGYADKLIEDLGLEKWNDGPHNTMERYMTRWFERTCPGNADQVGR